MCKTNYHELQQHCCQNDYFVLSLNVCMTMEGNIVHQILHCDFSGYCSFWTSWLRGNGKLASHIKPNYSLMWKATCRRTLLKNFHGNPFPLLLLSCSGWNKPEFGLLQGQTQAHGMFLSKQSTSIKPKINLGYKPQAQLQMTQAWLRLVLYTTRQQQEQWRENWNFIPLSSIACKDKWNPFISF